MDAPVSALLAAARRALDEAVRPELRSDHARSQLAGAMEILAKLERMADWSRGMVDEECAALEKGIAQFEVRAQHHARGLGLSPLPPFGLSTSKPTQIASTGSARADGGESEGASTSSARTEESHARIRLLTGWLFDTVPPGPQRDELDALLRNTLREAVAAERRHVPRTDFSSMTESKEP